MQNQRRVIIDRRNISVMLLALISFLALNQTANAINPSAPYQLNAELQVFGDVLASELSPDGQHLVYVSDQVFNGQFEIFSVPISGGAATRLNMPFSSMGSDIGSYKISADSQRVVYRADSIVDNQFELFSVPIVGGTSIRLNTNFPTGGDVISFAISPDSQRVVYRADQIVNERIELFSVATGGGSVQRLNSQLPAGGEVGEYEISPDSTRVVYIADQNFVEINQLFSASIVVGTNTEIIGSSRIQDFKITPDSRFIIFNSSNGVGGLRLVRAAIDGGASSTLHGSPLFSRVTSYKISPDSSHVVYLADQNIEDVNELFSVLIDGTGQTRLNENLAVSGEEFVGDVAEGFKISADSQGVIYLADQNIDNVFELFYVPIAGGSTTRLNADLPLDGDVLEQSFKFTPNSLRVVYQAEQMLNDVVDILSVSITGGTPTRLNDELPDGGDMGFGFEIAADSSFIVYRAQQNTAQVDELYLAPISGGSSKRLNNPLPGGADVGAGYEISSDSKYIIYRADQDVFDEIEVFGVEILDEDELCVPIKASNNNVVVICL